LHLSIVIVQLHHWLIQTLPLSSNYTHANCLIMMSTLTQPAHPASPTLTSKSPLKKIYKGTPAGPAADYTDILQNFALYETTDESQQTSRPYLAVFCDLL
jgi:hypothetical protein